jgi:hypothetical protein
MIVDCKKILVSDSDMHGMDGCYLHRSQLASAIKRRVNQTIWDWMQEMEILGI